MTEKEDDKNNEKSKYIKTIDDEAKYRPIVPFLGAGISISAGFPTIKFVIDYLAKVNFAIEYKIFEDRFPNTKPDDDTKLKSYLQHPSKYLEAFGWPNLGQLNTDIWDWLLSEKGQQKIFEKSIVNKKARKNALPDLLALDILSDEEKIKKLLKDYELLDILSDEEKRKNLSKDFELLDIRLDAKIKKLLKNYELLDILSDKEKRKKLLEDCELLDILSDEEKIKKLLKDYELLDILSDEEKRKKLSKDFELLDIRLDAKIKKLLKNYELLDFRHYQQAIVQWVLRKEQAGHEINTEQAILKEWLNWKKYHYAKDNKIKLEPGLLYGDWEALLDKLCEGHFNLTDSLFTLLEQGLKPTLSHRYLTFLQSKLGMPVLLTTNFDSLLERAFNQENIHPKIFDIHRDAELPDATLVYKQLSLLKLHGSAYGLKFGERLKHSLKISDRDTACAYIPEDALIIVMGFNGSERRIMQMLLAFVQQVESESKNPDKPRLIWIQGPGEPGPLFNEMLEDYEKIVKRVDVKHIDTFIQELYFHITRHSYPSSVKNYSTIPNQPLTTAKLKVSEAFQKNNHKKRCPVQLYTIPNQPLTTVKLKVSEAFQKTNHKKRCPVQLYTIPNQPLTTVKLKVSEAFQKTNHKKRCPVQLYTIPNQPLTTVKLKVSEAFQKTNHKKRCPVQLYTIPNQPLTTVKLKVSEAFQKTNHKKRCPVQVYIDNNDRKPPYSSWPSLAAMEFVSSLNKGGYTSIWIDFESHHTLEGIITEIFNRVRIIDPQAPLFSLGSIVNDKPGVDTIIFKAVECIFEVFKRGRYILVLDLVESFGRPQMVHHGMRTSDTDTQNEEYFKNTVENLSKFIHKLLNITTKDKNNKNDEQYFDSYVVVTSTQPRHRHPPVKNKDGSPSYIEIKKLINSLDIDKSLNSHIFISKSSSYDDIIDQDQGKFTPNADLLEKFSPHWNPLDTNNKTEIKKIVKNSQKRTNNILELLTFFRKEYNSNDKPSQPVTQAFIAMLSIFRRPRSLPLLRSFIERWGLRSIDEPKDLKIDGLEDSKEEKLTYSHERVNELLTLISTSKNSVGVVSQNHEGGVVWLFREVYEGIYDAFSENIHRQKWKDYLDKNSEEPLPIHIAIMDGLLAINWHLYAARAYYVDVFLASHDIQAFLEYLYHRVSAIKTMTLLISIIDKVKGDKRTDIRNNLNTYCDHFKESYKKILQKKDEEDEVTEIESFRLFSLVLGIFDPIKHQVKQDLKDLEDLNNIEGLRNHLAKLRLDSLNTLLMALNKNKLRFRVEAVPDSVLAWSNQFLRFELESMEDEKNEKNEKDENFCITKTIKELKELFTRLELQSLRDKMDYETALDRSLHVESKTITIDNAIKEFKISITNINNDFDKPKKNLNTLFNIIQCLLETYDPQVKEFIKCIIDGLLEIIKKIENKNKNKNENENITKWAKKSLLFAYQLNCKIQFKDYNLWQLLLERDHCERITENKKVCEQLKEAEDDSIRYENLIQTQETNDKDAQYRSTALTIRARALYLRGHFAQAHHILDLGLAGLFSKQMSDWLLISIVHIIRAELLTISANEHYFSLSENYDGVLKALKKYTKKSEENKPYKEDKIHNVLLKAILKKPFADIVKEIEPIAASSLKKINRAEEELIKAEAFFNKMAHQKNWATYMQFGLAQVQIEKMLFKMELLFLSWKPLNVEEYLKESGALESKILKTMQRIRNVLDTIPYQASKWKDVKEKYAESNRSVVNIECNAFKLWRQLFVVGSYYSKLLSGLYKGFEEITLNETQTTNILRKQNLIIRLFNDQDDERYREQWALWCIAMRFSNFKDEKNMKTFSQDLSQKEEGLKSISLRATVIKAMLVESHNEKGIEIMWDLRRPTN